MGEKNLVQQRGPCGWKRKRKKVRVVDEFRVTDLCMCTGEMRGVDRKYRAVGHLRKLDLFS